MPYSEEYVQYLIQFHATRDWFECHEIMEEAWKEEADPERKRWWLALVQIAVGFYHERRGNLAGARKMLSSALTHAEQVPWDKLGIDGTSLQALINQHLQWCNQAGNESQSGFGQQEESRWNLPIQDEALLAACYAQCAADGLTWCVPIQELGDDIVHRHKLRDRTEVIVARQEAWNLRNQ
ncbi:DUF309 domain-containing protein [Paenibacillus sp. 481]|uniref:DUF309 domain-containing protein n=1 Tax=Paenibacillus sp. 481 TaxID=2835869 RepID=UPI001E2FC397|nr:DUF309 domain-containing protein [Paenibacillus sp. 481]UHA73047.1 DUF309 domain-containing protein [Paenibacillus sp. 481]